MNRISWLTIPSSFQFELCGELWVGAKANEQCSISNTILSICPFVFALPCQPCDYVTIIIVVILWQSLSLWLFYNYDYCDYVTAIIIIVIMWQMRTNLLSLFIPFIRLQLDVERLMYILAFNPVLFKLKLYVILNLALLTLARIKFSPLFAFARLEFTDDRFKRIFITKIHVYICLKLKDFNGEHKNHYDIALIQPIILSKKCRTLFKMC